MVPDRGDEIRSALATDQTIDIVTTGARSGRARTTEIWFTNVSGRIIICGTPITDESTGRYERRDWLANLDANPDFLFVLKESVSAELTATAEIVRDDEERRSLMLAPETQWYRENSESVEAIVEGSPIVEVRFSGHFGWLND